MTLFNVATSVGRLRSLQNSLDTIMINLGVDQRPPSPPSALMPAKAPRTVPSIRDFHDELRDILDEMERRIYAIGDALVLEENMAQAKAQF